MNRVLMVQRSYRLVIFRRVVRRAVMDKGWEKFIEVQKKLSMKAELLFKKSLLL